MLGNGWGPSAWRGGAKVEKGRSVFPEDRAAVTAPTGVLGSRRMPPVLVTKRGL